MKERLTVWLLIRGGYIYYLGFKSGKLENTALAAYDKVLN